MNEVIMIITRCGKETEWINYCGFKCAMNVSHIDFGNNTIAKKEEALLNEPFSIEISSNTKVIFFRGETGWIPQSQIKLTIPVSTKLLIIIHASTDGDFNEYRRKFENKFNIAGNEAIEIIKGYSLGDYPNVTDPVYSFEQVIQYNRNDTFATAYEALYNFVKKKNNLQLIALSILCQGYLAAHGETNELKGWDQLDSNLKTKVASKKGETEKASYWNVFGDELVQLEDKIKLEWGGEIPEKVTSLVTAIIDKNGVVDSEEKKISVNKAYAEIKHRLSGKTA